MVQFKIKWEYRPTGRTANTGIQPLMWDQCNKISLLYTTEYQIKSYMI